MVIGHCQSVPIHVIILEMVLNGSQNLDDFKVFLINVMKGGKIHVDRINEHLIVGEIEALKFPFFLFLVGLLIFKGREGFGKN